MTVSGGPGTDVCGDSKETEGTQSEDGVCTTCRNPTGTITNSDTTTNSSVTTTTDTSTMRLTLDPKEKKLDLHLNTLLTISVS